jgi:serine/threonine-protein kinase
LKPENLFLASRDDGTPCIKILDFGIAKITGGSAQALQGGKTETGTITGTPMFMSPEQIRGDNANVTGATDVWALGLIVFRLLSGGQYWTADTLPMLVAQIAYEPLATPSVRGVSLGTSFDDWFAKCCARDPAARFKTAGEAIDALEQALGLGARQSQPHFGHTAMAHTSPAMSVASPLAGSLQGASVSHAGMAAPVRKTSRTWMLIVGAAIVALGAVGTIAVMKNRSVAAGASTASTTTATSTVVTAPTTPGVVTPTPTVAADVQPNAPTSVRLSTVQPNIVRSARPLPSTTATVSAAPPPPPPPPPPPSTTATATAAKKPSDNDLLNQQH